MTAKEHYTLAYRTFRASKGSAVLRGDEPIRKAYGTYLEQFVYCQGVQTTGDPLGCSRYHAAMVHAGIYTARYARSRISLLYRHNTRFTEVLK
jgi:hypothetical protein